MIAIEDANGLKGFNSDEVSKYHLIEEKELSE
jgi:hypothetical protein